MTHDEFFKKALNSCSLCGKEREMFLSELEEDIKSIENPKEQSEARKVLEDIEKPYSILKKELQEAANHGDSYAKRKLQLFDCGIEGKDAAFYQENDMYNTNDMYHHNYKLMFVGLDDINVINKYQIEDSCASIYLAQMGNVPDDEIAPIGDKYQIGYDALEKYKFQIAETITKKIQELAYAAWQIGKPVDEEKLEDLISYINTPYENPEIQGLNSKNVKRIFKEFIEAFNLDTDEWIYTDINIYSDKFKNLCKIHIYLPIEGEVTGVYFFERYYGKTRSKNASVNFLEQIMPNDNENKPQDTEENILSIEYYSSETEKEIIAGLDFVNNPEKLEMVKSRDKKTWQEIKNNNGYIKDKQQKRYDSYKENFPKIYDFSLDNYPKEEVMKLGDLLNYIEYDLLDKGENLSDTDKLSKKINIFLMLKSPAIEIFEKIPSKDIAERDCFIFLKSEILRHIELADILALSSYIARIFSSLPRTMKSAASSIIEDAVLYNMVHENIVDKDEIRDDYKTHLDRLNALNFRANGKTKNDNLFLIFMMNIIIDELRLELKIRNKNVKSVVEIDSEYIATETPNFKDMVLKAILESPQLLPAENFELYQIHYDLPIKKFTEKLQSPMLSCITLDIIKQLCKFSDNIKITLSKSYNNTRTKTMSLKELLKSKIKGKEVKRILSYLIERQFYYNLGYGQEYEIMNDFRVALESKACDLIRTNFDAADYHTIINETFGEKWICVLNNETLDFDIDMRFMKFNDEVNYIDSLNTSELENLLYKMVSMNHNE